MNPRKKEILQEIIAVSDYIAALIRPLHETNIPIKNGTWTIGAASAHLVISQKFSKKILQGEENPYKNAKPETVSAMNRKLLSEFPERRGDRLATMLVMNTEAFVKEAERHSDDSVIKTHFGPMNMLTSFSYNLCHLLIHGCHIAKTLKKPLPIEEKHIPMVLPFLKRAMEITYDKESVKHFQGTYVIKLRNINPYAISCNGSAISITEEIPQHVDCFISADPKSFFLVSTGNANQWSELVKGKILIWGRKPWLALRLPKLFRNP